MARLSEEQKRQIRNRILEVSKEHFIANGYNNTSTKLIASEVGIAEGTIFNYFESKADLFLESLEEVYTITEGDKVELDFTKSVHDIIFDFVYETLKLFINIPKSLLKEMGIASLNIAKKRPEVIKKLAELDYKAMEELENLFIRLIKQGLVKECEVKVASETIYSIVLFEVVIYSYENELKKEDMFRRIKEKIAFILGSYVVL